MKKSFWISLVLSALLVIFSVLNAKPVGVNFIFKEVEISLAILLIVVFLSGVIAGASYFYIKTKRTVKNKQTEEDTTAEELNEND